MGYDHLLGGKVLLVEKEAQHQGWGADACQKSVVDKISENLKKMLGESLGESTLTFKKTCELIDEGRSTEGWNCVHHV